MPTWRSLDTSAESSVTPNSLCCSPTSEPLAAVLAPLLSCSSGFASHSSLALAPSLRLRWDGSRWPSCRAGGWQPLSLHLTCPGLLAGVLLCEIAAPARWQPCRHPADSVLSLCSTSGLHPRSLPRCAGPVCRSQRGFHPLCHSPAPLLQPVTGAVLATRFGCTRGPLSQPDAAPGLQPDTSSHQVGGSRGSAGAWLDLRLYQTYHWCSLRRMDPAVAGPPAVLHWIQPDYGLSGGLESIWFDAKAGF